MTAAARNYDRLQRELADDERRAIEASGQVAPNHDGSPRTVIRSRVTQFGDALVTLYTARCSCSWVGHEYGAAAYKLALDERNQHRCSTSEAALDILRREGLL